MRRDWTINARHRAAAPLPAAATAPLSARRALCSSPRPGGDLLAGVGEGAGDGVLPGELALAGAACEELAAAVRNTGGHTGGPLGVTGGSARPLGGGGEERRVREIGRVLCS